MGLCCLFTHILCFTLDNGIPLLVWPAPLVAVGQCVRGVLRPYPLILWPLLTTSEDVFLCGWIMEIILAFFKSALIKQCTLSKQMNMKLLGIKWKCHLSISLGCWSFQSVESTVVHLKRCLCAVLHFYLLVSVLHCNKILLWQAREPRGGSCF